MHRRRVAKGVPCAEVQPYDHRMAVAGDASTDRQTGQPAGAVRGWLVARVALLALVLGLVVTTTAVGRAPGELASLTSALSSHRLASVTVVGDGLPDEATGCRTQRVVWRRHGLLRSVDVMVQRGDVDGCGMGMTETLDPAITDAAVWLPQLDPGVTIHREPWPAATGTIGRWTVPPVILGIALPTGLAGLLLLVSGPKPWRATRWAWFWLTGSLVGAVAFLVLSGPTPGLPEPHRPQRRLTGGWAFLLALPLAAIAPTWLVLTS
jgi:hypothetical protein